MLKLTNFLQFPEQKKYVREPLPRTLDKIFFTWFCTAKLSYCQVCAFLAHSFADLLVTLLEIPQTGLGLIMEIQCFFTIIRCLLFHYQNVPDDLKPSGDAGIDLTVLCLLVISTLRRFSSPILILI